jgi:hypothetical protein
LQEAHEEESTGHRQAYLEQKEHDDPQADVTGQRTGVDQTDQS